MKSNSSVTRVIIFLKGYMQEKIEKNYLDQVHLGGYYSPKEPDPDETQLLLTSGYWLH